MPATELAGAVGPPDVTIMRRIRTLFLEAEPLVEATSFDSVLHPQELTIQFEDGIGTADQCRLDVTWFRSGAYRFHYVDTEEVNWRFDRHPNTHSPAKHFHEPPEAHSETAVASCITVDDPSLVARAVLKLWRRAYEMDDLEVLNTASDPP
ncbi:hypothetical protein [Haloarcula sp. JP-L23]|uniref:hypothetical protein n=1 Tax=Haloarcula sp. JP-L23 TaxID=2716717 RepID=UPI003743E6B1